MSQSQNTVKDKAYFKIEYPSGYYVKIYNDDFTTMDFVVKMLRNVFFKNELESFDIMMTIHKEGSEILGPYTYDIACSKRQKAIKMARDEGYPLRLDVITDPR